MSSTLAPSTVTAAPAGCARENAADIAIARNTRRIRASYANSRILEQVGFAPGTILMGKYRVDGPLGAGGYGMVVKAHHLLAEQEVAIKILRDDVELDE